MIEALVESIYAEPRAGRPLPTRIELGADLFPAFKAAHREALAAILSEVDSVYPGSLCGVPIVERGSVAATLVRTDGRRDKLVLKMDQPAHSEVNATPQKEG